jgi:hypothetical protein
MQVLKPHLLASNCRGRQHAGAHILCLRASAGTTQALCTSPCLHLMVLMGLEVQAACVFRLRTQSTTIAKGACKHPRKHRTHVLMVKLQSKHAHELKPIQAANRKHTRSRCSPGTPTEAQTLHHALQPFTTRSLSQHRAAQGKLELRSLRQVALSVHSMCLPPRGVQLET